MLHALAHGVIVGHIHLQRRKGGSIAGLQASAGSIDGHPSASQILSANLADSGRGSGDQDNLFIVGHNS
jgi:hypothetical protein